MSTRPGELLGGGMPAALDADAQVDASVVDGGPAHGCRALDVRVAGGIDVRVPAAPLVTSPPEEAPSR